MSEYYSAVGCKCQGCGDRYYDDVVVDNTTWECIKPDGKPYGAGLLCGKCIYLRITERLEARIAELEQDRDSLQRLANCRVDQRDALTAHVERLNAAISAWNVCRLVPDNIDPHIDAAPATSLTRRDSLQRAGAFEIALDLVEGRQAKSVLRRLAFVERNKLEDSQ